MQFSHREGQGSQQGEEFPAATFRPKHPAIAGLRPDSNHNPTRKDVTKQHALNLKLEDKQQAFRDLVLGTAMINCGLMFTLRC